MQKLIVRRKYKREVYVFYLCALDKWQSKNFIGHKILGRSNDE